MSARWPSCSSVIVSSSRSEVEPPAHHAQTSLDEEGHLEQSTDSAPCGIGHDPAVHTGASAPAETRRDDARTALHMTRHDDWGVAEGWWATDGSLAAGRRRHPDVAPSAQGAALRHGSAAHRRSTPDGATAGPTDVVRPCRPDRTPLWSPATIELDGRRRARRCQRRLPADLPLGAHQLRPARRRPDDALFVVPVGAHRRPSRGWGGRPSSTPPGRDAAGAMGDLGDLGELARWTDRRRRLSCWPTTPWVRRCRPPATALAVLRLDAAVLVTAATCASSRAAAPICVGEQLARGGRCGRSAQRRRGHRPGPGLGAQAGRARVHLGSRCVDTACRSAAIWPRRAPTPS